MCAVGVMRTLVEYLSHFQFPTCQFDSLIRCSFIFPFVYFSFFDDYAVVVLVVLHFNFLRERLGVGTRFITM